MNQIEIVFHWDADQDTWAEMSWDSFLAFRGFNQAPVPLPGLSGGIHFFAVVVFVDQSTVNIIAHKYMVDPGGRIGSDNFSGLNKEERAELARLYTLSTHTPAEQAMCTQLQQKAGDHLKLPADSLSALEAALPHPVAPGSRAAEILASRFALN